MSMSKKIRYLCIDDKPDEVKPALKQLERANLRLAIRISPPGEFRDQVGTLQKLRKNGELDGLILDLRLDQSGATGERPVDYKAQLLANELRTLMAASKIDDFPIVLWSITSKLALSYDKDITSHDLFDLVLDKEHLADCEPSAAEQLASIATAYATVAEQPRNSSFWKELLHTPKMTELDPRIGEEFTPTLKKVPVHVLTRYVFEEIIRKPGPLIDEATLCARLGIQQESISETKLGKTLVTIAGYTGPFSEAWHRWWWSAIEGWWRSRDAENPALLSLTATERVEKLREIFRYQRLKPAEPIEKGYSSRFTTICQSLRRPLDPVDGFMLAASDLKPWHDRLYVCTSVALKPKKHGFVKQLDSLEAERLRALRKK